MYSRIAVFAVPPGDSFRIRTPRKNARRGPATTRAGKLPPSGGPLRHFPEAVRYSGDTRRNPVVTGRFDAVLILPRGKG